MAANSQSGKDWIPSITLFHGDFRWQLSSRISNSASRELKTSTKRAAIFKAEAKKLGAKVKDIYWTLGEHDGLLILEAPDDETATAAILHLGAMGNVHTTTCQPFTAAEMDKIVAKVYGG